MNIVILLVSVVLPLLPVVMFPTRFIGRGVGGTLLGAALIVGAMMLIYLSMQFATGGGDTPGKAASAAPDADMAALEQLLGN